MKNCVENEQNIAFLVNLNENDNAFYEKSNFSIS